MNALADEQQEQRLEQGLTEGAELPSEKTAKELEELSQRLETENSQEQVKAPQVETPTERPPAQRGQQPTGGEQQDDEEIPPEFSKSEWAFKQRQRRREMQKQIDEQNSELERFRNAQQQTPQPRPEEPAKADAEMTLRYMVMAQNEAFPATGNMSKEERNSEIIRYANKALNEEIPSHEIAQVITQASEGKYGTMSAEIASIAKEALPVAIARESGQRQEQEARQAQVAAEQTRVHEELRETVKAYPMFADANSPEYKHIQTWMDEYVGQVDANGIPVGNGVMSKEEAQYVLGRPKLQARLVLDHFRAAQGMRPAGGAQAPSTPSQPKESGPIHEPSRAQSDPKPMKGSDRIMAEIEEKYGPLDRMN